ncbi:cupredoxin domain-containing protein [Planktotalea arctica]|uniref:cupredoxin domain-containing protein n=2 Tax=Planktotalea arctica TaxID=1481893 RepID=UPI00111C7521|nr:hypothetical protein [Planktotalea arctica]
MFKPVIFSLAAFAASLATSASAAEHEILFVEGGFFPAVTYLAAGDVVTFTNLTDSTVEAEAGDESWQTGQLNVNATYTLTVTAATGLAFAYATDPEKSGALSFDPAPINN